MPTNRLKAPTESAHGDQKTSNVTPAVPQLRSGVMLPKKLNLRASAEDKVVGLKNYGLEESVYQQRRQFAPPSLESKRTMSHTNNIENDKSTYVSIEEMEDIARYQATRNPFQLLILGNIAAAKVREPSRPRDASDI
jgi:hypothetical protein